MGLSLEPVTEVVWIDDTPGRILLTVADRTGEATVSLTDAEADRVANALMRVVESRLSAEKEAA